MQAALPEPSLALAGLLFDTSTGLLLTQTPEVDDRPVVFVLEDDMSVRKSLERPIHTAPGTPRRSHPRRHSLADPDRTLVC